MKRLKMQWLGAMGFALPLLLLNSIAFGQTKTVDITVDGQLPMAAAINKIMELSGIPINSEDMPVYYSGDLRDVTDLVARTPIPGGGRILAPRGGQLSVSIAVDATTGKLNDVQSVKDALSTAISAYNSSGLPGGYDFEEYNGVFFVKPVSYRDEKGATQPMKPLLSTLITLPEEKRDWYVTIRLILQQISKAAGSYVGFGAWPLNAQTEVIIGSNNEPADHVIARVLAAMECPNSAREGCAPVIAQTSWDVGLFCNLLPQPRGMYLLGVGQVPNSRWFVPPTPAQPYTPPTPRPKSDGPAAGSR